MAFECPRRSSPPSPMFDADTGCIATDPAPSARRRFRSKTGIENLPANEHAQETPHTPSPTRTTRRIQSGCAGSRPRLRDGMPGSPSQHIDITRAKWIPYIEEYDLVIVDCPPNLGIITLNGLRISDSYIIPTIPDHLSTYGIPQIVTRVQDFSEAISETIEPTGIVATKYQANSTVHKNVLKQLRDDDKLPVVMDTIIRQANSVAAAAEHQPYQQRTLKQKYGSELANQYDELAREIWNDLEG